MINCGTFRNGNRPSLTVSPVAAKNDTYSQYMEETDSDDQLVDDVSLLATIDADLFGHLAPYILTTYAESHPSPARLWHVCAGSLRPFEVHTVVAHLARSFKAVFKKSAFAQLLVESLEWEVVAQMCLWQFIHAAPNVTYEWVLPVLAKVALPDHATLMTHFVSHSVVLTHVIACRFLWSRPPTASRTRRC